MSNATPTPTPVAVERPTITRTRVNPFSEHFPIDEGAKAWTVPAKTDADQKALKKMVSQLRSAGKAANRTTRLTVTEEKGMATVTAWTVPKITHKDAKQK